MATASGLAALLATVWFGAPADLDPLALGPRGRWLVGALLFAVLLSVASSPLPRSGRLALLLLPALLVLPASVRRAWSSAPRRRLGLTCWRVGLAGVAAWALFESLLSGEVARGTLGHHLLVVACLLPTLPVVASGARAGRGALLVRGVSALVVAALLATGSALALVGLLALVALWLRRRVRVVVGGFATLLLVVLAVGLLGPLQGEPSWGGGWRADLNSWRARIAYWEAGWQGWRERPWLGWGPGSTPWTVAERLTPQPGINPPGEVVGDLHSWPLQGLRETGLLGVSIAIWLVALWWWRRRREERGVPESLREWLALRRSARWGLVALACYSLAGVALGTLAPWVVLGLVLGVGQLAPLVDPGADRTPERRPHLVWRVYAVVAAIALMPTTLAHWHFDRALEAATEESAERHLALAVRLDPAFPLYRFASGQRPHADLAVSAFWLTEGSRAASLYRRVDLERAVQLDPLSWAAAWRLHLEDPHSAAGTYWGARAVLLEPRLLASTGFAGQPGLRTLIARQVRGWPGVDPGLRMALSDALTRSAPAASDGELILEWDGEGEPAASVYLFRRRPAPRILAAVEVDLDLADSLALPSAAALDTTSREAFAIPPADAERSRPELESN